MGESECREVKAYRLLKIAGASGAKSLLHAFRTYLREGEGGRISCFRKMLKYFYVKVRSVSYYLKTKALLFLLFRKRRTKARETKYGTLRFAGFSPPVRNKCPSLRYVN